MFDVSHKANAWRTFQILFSSYDEFDVHVQMSMRLLQIFNYFNVADTNELRNKSQSGTSTSANVEMGEHNIQRRYAMRMLCHAINKQTKYAKQISKYLHWCWWLWRFHIPVCRLCNVPVICYFCCFWSTHTHTHIQREQELIINMRNWIKCRTYDCKWYTDLTIRVRRLVYL